MFQPLLPAQKLVQMRILEIENKIIKEHRHRVHAMRPRHISIKKPPYQTMRDGKEMEVV